VVNKSVTQIRDELINRISRCDEIISGLQGSNAFKLALEDFENTKKRIDDYWQYEGDAKKLETLRITKLATISILNIVENYKFDMEKAKQELYQLDNPDKIIKKDYDEG
jgi:hypothetical protein